MVKIVFKIDLEKEACNWVRIAQLKKHPFGGNLRANKKDIPKDVLLKIKNVPRDKAIRIAYRHLMKKSENFMTLLEANKKLFEFYFKYKGQDLVKAIEKITGKRIYTSKITVYFTLMNSCPYNPKDNSFMIAARRPMPKQLTILCHELLHLQFLAHYGDYCLSKGLSNKQLADLKEALTFLLNDKIFKNFYLAPDHGYAMHKQLRSKLKKIWDKNKKFKVFLDKAIKKVIII